MKLFLWSALSASVMGLGLTVSMRAMPFGLAFTASVIAFIAGTSITSLLLSLKLLGSKFWWKKALSGPLLIVFVLFVFLSIILLIDNTKGYTLLANTVIQVIPEDNRGSLGKMVPALNKEQWYEDIEYLKTELPKHHAYPFLHMKESDFNNAIEQLKSNLASLNDREIVFEICRIVSMIKDGHTQLISVPFNIPPFIESRLFPIRIFHYSSGMYVTDGGRDNEHLTGLRILKIGDVKIEDVVKKVIGYVPGENEYYKMQWSFPYLLNAQLLKHLGIIEDATKAEFTFSAEDGKEVKKILKPILSPLYLRWYQSSRDLDDLSGRSKLNENYWYEYSDHNKVLYFQLNQIASQEGKSSLKQFSSELNKFIEQHDVNKIIVDIRNCNGGDNSQMKPLLSLLTNPKVNQRGKLFALIGRQTYSAGISFLSYLERNTNVTLIGEPAGSGPNQCGDVQSFALPHSRLLLQVSSKFHQQGFYKDKRLTIEPDLNVKYAYQRGEKKDLALEAIYSYPIKLKNTLFDFDSTKFDSLVGRYSYDVDKILTIKKSDGHLIYEIGDYNIFASGPMYPISATSFNTNSPQLFFQFLNFDKNPFHKIGITWGTETDTLIRLPNTYQSPAELVNQNKIDDALTIYLNAKAMGIHLAATTEAELNSRGYEFLALNDFETAVKIFNVNTILFPFSGNAWDSLGEIWLKKGDSERAKIYYRKSLELNPENRSAKEAVKKLDNYKGD